VTLLAITVEVVLPVLLSVTLSAVVAGIGWVVSRIVRAESTQAQVIESLRANTEATRQLVASVSALTERVSTTEISLARIMERWWKG
jgi:hypothetical protein